MMKNSVVYQIYPKSFYDTNHDGFGDLNGITAKLDYLKALGVDYLWLTPFYVSPQKDNGYDIADYYTIDKTFGTMADFERLVTEAKKRGIELMLDMVFNHTSTEHKWFKNALAGDPYYKNFYIFKEGKDGKPPTNWESKFGGSAWEYVEQFDAYYLHLFDVTQGDLNWENECVRQEVFNVVNFWLDKGVKGFRLDVINLISKPATFEDDPIGDGRHFYTDGPKIHDFLKELNHNTFGRSKDIITVGEMSSTSIEECIRYANPDEHELSMVFNFHHLKVDYVDGNKWSVAPFDFKSLKQIFKEWQYGMQEGNGWSALFWCNHDQPRIVSRFGNDTIYHKESAKMLATTVHMMRGTPYIYQGEEFGMTNPYFDKIEDYRDVESINYYNILKAEGMSETAILEILQSKSRDNSRTPMQWDDSLYSGFSTTTPWLPVGKYYKEINVMDALNNTDSVFYHYQKLIALRKQFDVIAEGRFDMLLESHPQVFAYKRTLNDISLIVLNNFYDTDATIVLDELDAISFHKNTCILSNYTTSQELSPCMILKPYESIVYKVER